VDSVQISPERSQGRHASRQLVGSVGVAGLDASLELSQAPMLTFDDQLAFVLRGGAQASQEGLPGIGRPFQIESAGDGRI
jgi:hypothetical protein